MKKVKVILSAVLVLAVVGGALAFKTTKFNDPFCIVTSVTDVNASTPQQDCEIAIDTRQDNAGTYFLATPNPLGRPCTELKCPPIKLGSE